MLNKLKNENKETTTVFRPLSALRNKFFLYNITAFILVTAGLYLFSIFMSWATSFDTDDTSQFTAWIQQNASMLITGYLLISFVLMIIVAIITVFYVRAMEFQIGEDEVIVKKGIINKMEKHVPFRTITNVSSRYGIYDRLFGIGTVQIETAGKSGAQGGPEEKIEGISNYFEVRDQILDVLRQFRHQYTTGTEVPESLKPVTLEKPFEKELLDELREIKEILRK